jgi:hypothetical protein
MKTCLLVRDFHPLLSQRLIESEDQKQLNLIAKGRYIPSNLVIFGRGTLVNTAEIDDWLRGLNLAPVTRNTFRRDLARLEFSQSMKLPDCLKQQTMHRCRILRSGLLLTATSRIAEAVLGRDPLGIKIDRS